MRANLLPGRRERHGKVWCIAALLWASGSAFATTTRSDPSGGSEGGPTGGHTLFVEHPPEPDLPRLSHAAPAPAATLDQRIESILTIALGSERRDHRRRRTHAAFRHELTTQILQHQQPPTLAAGDRVGPRRGIWLRMAGNPEHAGPCEHNLMRIGLCASPIGMIAGPLPKAALVLLGTLVCSSSVYTCFRMSDQSTADQLGHHIRLHKGAIENAVDRAKLALGGLDTAAVPALLLSLEQDRLFYAGIVHEALAAVEAPNSSDSAWPWQQVQREWATDGAGQDGRQML